MTKIGVTFLMALLWSWSSVALGQKSCLPGFMALQTMEMVQASKLETQVFALDSENASGRFKTKAQLRLFPNPEKPGQIQVTVQFDPSFQGVSLPYNVYALLLVLDGQVVGWWDYTDGCRGPGMSFFPGAQIRLGSLNVVGEQPQKLQIMVWGRL